MQESSELIHSFESSYGPGSYDANWTGSVLRALLEFLQKNSIQESVPFLNALILRNMTREIFWLVDK